MYTRDRGQSETIGVVLLLAITVLGVVTVVTVGEQTLHDGERSVRVEQAEQSMTQLDTRASDVALGHDGSEVGQVDFGLPDGAGHLGTVEGSWMRVSLINATTGADDAVIANRSLGTVRYDEGGTSVAYEGGGVWRADEAGATMVSRPEFHFRGDTLTVPVVSIDGERSLNGRVRVTADGPPDRRFPNRSAGLGNRLPDTKLQVTVRSEYYRAWGRFFERSTNGIVRYDHAAETVTVTYLSVPTSFGLESGIIATSGAGEVRLGGNSIYIDSYNSSRGTGRYVDTQSANGSVTAAGDVVATGSSNVQGNVRSGDVVDLSGTTDISGTVYWTSDYQQDGASVNGGDEQIDGVASLEPIDGYVENTVSEARQTNNNTEVSAISGNELTGSGTLPAGTYYLENMTIGPGDTLNVDTSGGDVTIAVEDTVTVAGKGTQSSKAARINVTGNGTATVFVRGDDPVDFEMGKNGQVDVPDERSGQFRVYGTRDFDAEITSDQSPAELRFEGVVYAPAGYTGSGSVVIGQAKLFGAIVTGDLTVKQGAEIHYDTGLADERFPRSPTLSRVEFLHVTVHPVRVEDA